MRVLRWIGIIVLAIGVALGGLKLYLHYEARSVVEEAIENAPPVLDIRYGGVSAGLDGTIGVNDLTVSPRTVNDEVQIERLEIRTSGVGFLLRRSERLRKGELPERMGLLLRGISLDLNGALVAAWQRSLEEHPKLIRDSALDCGDVHFIGPEQYRAMGYSRLVSDLAVSYELLPRSTEARVQLEASTRDAAYVAMELVIAGVGSPTVLGLMQSKPRISELTFRYVDDSYVQRLNRLCAQRRGLGVEGYITAQVKRSDAAYARAWGLVPGPGLREAYKHFLTQPGEVIVRAHPSGGLDPLALSHFGPSDWVDLLNLTLTVNKQPVSDLSMRAPTAAELKSAPEGPGLLSSLPQLPALSPGGKEEASDKAAPVARRAAPARPIFKYQSVEPAELKDYIGKQVRIATRDHRRREGRLTSVDRGVATLRRRMHGGEMTVRVPLDGVKRAEVLLQSDS